MNGRYSNVFTSTMHTRFKALAYFFNKKSVSFENASIICVQNEYEKVNSWTKLAFKY